MSAVSTAAALCRQFEGFYSSPYLCPAGVPTIGYGSTYYEDGRRVTLRDPAITRDRAEQLLQYELSRQVFPAVALLCPGLNTENRAAALLDFTYNLGSGNLRSSTLRRKINAGDWAAVPSELAKWVRGGGRVLPGLVRRRAAEAALI
jgi:lysozyme